MNALEIAKQLLKNLQDKPEGVEEIKKSFTKQEQPAATSKNGFEKSMLDEDFGETFAKRKKIEMEKKQGVPKGVNPAKQERCVKEVKGKGAKNPYAVCNASLQGQTKKDEMGKVDPIVDATAKKPPMRAAAPAAAPAPAPASPGMKFKAKFAKPKSIVPTMKAENPDKEEDAKLGEQVERDVEQHMRANKEAERKEGHKISFDKSMLKEEYGFDKKC